MKIGTKLYARLRRNELAEATGRWTGRWKRDRTQGPDAGGNRPDAGTQRPIEYREVLERRNYDQTRPVAGDRTLAASDQWFVVQRSGQPDTSCQDDFSVRSVAEKRNFVSNGYFLHGAYK